MRFIARHAGEEIPIEVERHGNSYRVRVGDRLIEGLAVTVREAEAVGRRRRREDDLAGAEPGRRLEVCLQCHLESASRTLPSTSPASAPRTPRRAWRPVIRIWAS